MNKLIGIHVCPRHIRFVACRSTQAILLILKMDDTHNPQTYYLVCESCGSIKSLISVYTSCVNTLTIACLHGQIY